MAKLKKMTKRGFTLIELMIVVVIIGVLAALAIYGVQKYVANSKSAEARMMLGRMSKDILTVFDGENQTYKILDFGETADISRALCPAAGVSLPSVPAGEKMMPDPADFRDESTGTGGWTCMRTTITTPTYYQYYTTSDQATTLSAGLTSAAADDAFTAFGVGDLDGDSVTSLFSLGVAVKANDEDFVLVLATTIDEAFSEE